MKVYEKPRIYIERFELSQHIAACAWDMSNSKTVEECSARSDPDFDIYEGVNAFMAVEKGCINGPLEDYCYTNGEAGSNIFNS